MTAVIVNLKPVMQMTDDQFWELCQANPSIKFERNATGALIILAPTGGETGNDNFELTTDFGIWNRQTQLGVGFDSSTCFKLPNKAQRSPDVAWVTRDRWAALSPADRQRFPPIAPDFVLELVSPSDDLTDVQAKMREYRENGVRLGWLIDPETKRVEIYRQGQAVQVLQAPETLSGEDVLPGFVLNLATLW
ncbi:MAG: Uma2 family endonuclease [Leptolyngbyaceae cyanobacterium bins.349]|nr:Uma2 family endonuclease [Leptolyngbyaceae cyanobacterium bins.349]